MHQAELLRALEGVQTVKTTMDILGCNRQAAIRAVHRLRKAGYVRTERARRGLRVYRIRARKWKETKGTSFGDSLAKDSNIPLAPYYDYIVHGRMPTREEMAVFATASGDIRTIHACLFLFRRIHNWKLLYRLAKEQGVVRPVGALYDLSRHVVRTRRMDGRIRNKMLPRPGDRYQDIVPGFRSRDFGSIEAHWKVHIPLNRADLEEIA